MILIVGFSMLIFWVSNKAFAFFSAEKSDSLIFIFVVISLVGSILNFLTNLILGKILYNYSHSLDFAFRSFIFWIGSQLISLSPFIILSSGEQGALEPFAVVIIPQMFLSFLTWQFFAFRYLQR